MGFIPRYVAIVERRSFIQMPTNCCAHPFGC